MIFSILFSAVVGLWAAPSTEEAHYKELFIRQELLQKTYRDRFIDLTDINRQESLDSWYRQFFNKKENREFYRHILNPFNESILGKDYRRLLYYFIVTGQKVQAAQTVGFYLINAHTLVDYFVHNPRSVLWNAKLHRRVLAGHKPLNMEQVKDIEQCILNILTEDKVERGFNPLNSYAYSRSLYYCLDQNRWANSIKDQVLRIFESYKYYGAPFPISFSGLVGGNSVELFNELPIDARSILTLGEQLNLITNARPSLLSPLYSDMTVNEFADLMPSPQDALQGLFTTEEGFLNTVDSESIYSSPHPMLGALSNGSLGIYGEMLQSIRSAKESVFIDIFWMGGSIGMNLAKELMKKVIENPQFTVVIITDRQNKFQYGLELDMVYRYMRAFSEKFSQYHFYITPAQINLKRTALPEFVDLLVTNKTVNDLHSNESLKDFLEKDGFNLLAKSDHSKVMIIDGKRPGEGLAFVGSKNWTDSSGGVNVDEVARIQGPAAALILNSFYYDIFEAFIMDLDPRLGGAMVHNHIETHFPGENKNLSLRRKAIQKLLAAVDIVDRYKDLNYNFPYKAVGTAVVAPTQNNIYGTEMSPIEQNIQTILSAQKQVIIDDQFLYDPSVVEALKHVMINKKVKVYIMLESLLPMVPGEVVGAHIPNNLFLPELTHLGALAKWHLTPSEVLYAVLEDNFKHPRQTLSTTFHLKSITVDGVLADERSVCEQNRAQWKQDRIPVLITGSANKDIMTMSGGFRESQVAIYDSYAVFTHDCLFWTRWDDPDTTQMTDGLDFKLPPQAESLGFTKNEEFLNFLRRLLMSPYNFTKSFF